jgi:hypothetical protein
VLASSDWRTAMSFHRKAFLVWLALMISVGASAMVAAHLEPAPSEVKGEMEQLFEAARAHAKALRDAGPEEEAQRWEHLATAAREQLAMS